MKIKFTCKKCEHNYKFLTKEELCAFCYEEDFGEWPSEFIGGKEKEMKVKFKKHGGKKKKHKK